MNIALKVVDETQVNDSSWNVRFGSPFDTYKFSGKYNFVVPEYNNDFVNIESSDTNVVLSDGSQTKYLTFNEEASEFTLLFTFNSTVDSDQIASYLASLVKANLAPLNGKTVVLNTNILIDGVADNTYACHNNFWLIVHNQNNVKFLLSNSDIINHSLVVPKDTTELHVPSQRLLPYKQTFLYVNEIDTDVSNVVNLVLDLYKGVSVSVSLGTFVSSDPDLSDASQKKMISLMQAIGRFDIVNADTGCVYKCNLPLKENTTYSFYVDKNGVKVQPKPKLVYNSKVVHPFSVYSDDDEYVVVESGSTKILPSIYFKLYSKIKSLLKIKLQDEDGINWGEGFDASIECDDYNNSSYSFTNNTRLPIGLYVVKYLYLGTQKDQINPSYIKWKDYVAEVEYESEGKYKVLSPFYLFSNRPVITLYIVGEILEVDEEDETTLKLSLVGPSIDVKDSIYYDDNGLNIFKCKGSGYSLLKALKLRWINGVLKKGANFTSDGNIVVGNKKYYNILDTKGDSCTVNYYNNGLLAKSNFNANNGLLALSIDPVNIQDLPLPDWLLCKLSGSATDVHTAISAFINSNSKHYHNLVKGILSFLITSNFINFSIKDTLCKYPGLIFLFARIFRKINEKLKILGKRALYSLTYESEFADGDQLLPYCKQRGLIKEFIKNWRKGGFSALMKDRLYQPPLLVIAEMSHIHPTECNNIGSSVANSATTPLNLISEILGSQNSNDVTNKVVISGTGSFANIGDNDISESVISSILEFMEKNGPGGLLLHDNENSPIRRFRNSTQFLSQKNDIYKLIQLTSFNSSDFSAFIRSDSLTDDVPLDDNDIPVGDSDTHQSILPLPYPWPWPYNRCPRGCVCVRPCRKTLFNRCPKGCLCVKLPLKRCRRPYWPLSDGYPLTHVHHNKFNSSSCNSCYLHTHSHSHPHPHYNKCFLSGTNVANHNDTESDNDVDNVNVSGNSNNNEQLTTLLA
uniref:Spheroidin n=1 Tax=Anacridium aegyptium entomopoxvirus TaxID=124304 RepID=Q9IZ38_9POXV|nr:spheroidin [Anacridium aegyptium entomopoxvirus]